MDAALLMYLPAVCRMISEARIPIPHPARLTISASSRNWSRMPPSVAPIALRIPISRVRSVTETSMIFMIPIPPTRREIAAIPPRRRDIVLLI